MNQVRSTRTALDSEQRKIVVAVSVAAVTLLTLSASFNYVLPDMLTDLDATDSQTDMARQIPTIAALLVIFVAGAIGERLGARRVMLVSTLLYALGSAIVGAAPIMPVATLGLLFANVGKSALFVVGLAHMSSHIADEDGRAAAFASFSAVMPVTYLLMPLVAGVMLANTSWRMVAAVWCLSGFVGTITAVWQLLPADSRFTRSAGELLAPGAGGLGARSIGAGGHCAARQRCHYSGGDHSHDRRCGFCVTGDRNAADVPADAVTRTVAAWRFGAAAHRADPHDVCEPVVLHDSGPAIHVRFDRTAGGVGVGASPTRHDCGCWTVREIRPTQGHRDSRNSVVGDRGDGSGRQHSHRA